MSSSVAKPEDLAQPTLLLTIDQVAASLCLSTRTVEALIASGRISSIRIGRARRVPVEAVHAFIDKAITDQADGDFEPLPAEGLRFVGRAKKA